jgi:hypothetical protein
MVAGRCGKSFATGSPSPPSCKPPKQAEYLVAIITYFSIIRYQVPRVNRRAGRRLVAINYGYRYLGDVENRWLSTGGRAHNFILLFSLKIAQDYLLIYVS